MTESTGTDEPVPGGGPANIDDLPPVPLLTAPTPTSPYPPIGDYGFLSDCETTALVAPNGAVEWMCVPRLDSAPVFGALLDRGAGYFRLGAAEADVPHDRRYLPGTLVLETSWNVGEGWLIVRDALVMGPWRVKDPGRSTYHRPPTDYAAAHMLVAHRPVRERRGPAADGMRAGVRVRTAAGDLAAHRAGIPPGDRRRRRRTATRR